MLNISRFHQIISYQIAITLLRSPTCKNQACMYVYKRGLLQECDCLDAHTSIDVCVYSLNDEEGFSSVINEMLKLEAHF